MDSTNQVTKLKTIFMGTGDFAGVSLRGLIAEGYNIQAVFTKPDAAIGRDNKLVSNPVRDLAKMHKLSLLQPVRLDDSIVSEIKKIAPDLILVVAYGKILPRVVLDIPGFGCINIHPSLLPKFRGPSPIQNTLLAGEKETGVSIILMNERMDAGDIINQDRLEIEDADTFRTLRDKLARLSTKMLLETIPLWIDRRIEPQKQDDSQATICQLIEREDGHLVWEEDMEKIINRYRAMTPWPGVFSFWDDGKSIRRIKFIVLSSPERVTDDQSQMVGQVIRRSNDLFIRAFDGLVKVEKIQLEGKNEMTSQEFINGYSSIVGSILK